MIYIASPYSSPDINVMRERYEKVLEFTAKLINDGVVAYSPIVHNHPIAVAFGLPRSWDFWRRFDEEMVGRAASMIVLQLEGWFESIGVSQEIQIALRLNLTVEYVLPS